MSFVLTGTKTALAPGLMASFIATGGTDPITYSVLAGGAGGTVNASTGVYTAPAVAPSDPSKLYDTIFARDSLGLVATAKILVGTPLLLFCEIIQRVLRLADGRVWLWDQKVFQPTDAGLYIAVSVPRSKVFGNVIKPGLVNGVPDWSQVEQSVNVMATLDLDIMSRSTEALLRKEEVILALNSLYSEAQQEGNSFSIGRIPAGGTFLNLSQIDGAAIPYRFRISVNMQYAATNQKAADYIDDFEDAQVNTNP